MFVNFVLCILAHQIIPSIGYWRSFPVVKQPGHEAKHSVLSSVKLKNAWSCASVGTYDFLAYTQATFLYYRLFPLFNEQVILKLFFVHCFLIHAPCCGD